MTAKLTHRKDGTIAWRAHFSAGRAPRSQAYDAWDEGEMNAESSADRIELPEVGKTYLVAVQEYVGYNDFHQPISPQMLFTDHDGEGWRGNSNREIRRYHGWRGTTNDIAIYGLGVRKCLLAEVTGERSKTVRIHFGRDQVKDED